MESHIKIKATVQEMREFFEKDRPNTRLISDEDSMPSVSYSGIGQSNVAAN